MLSGTEKPLLALGFALVAAIEQIPDLLRYGTLGALVIYMYISHLRNVKEMEYRRESEQADRDERAKDRAEDRAERAAEREAAAAERRDNNEAIRRAYEYAGERKPNA